MATQSAKEGSVAVPAVVAMGLGALVTGYGVPILAVSLVGGVHILAIGLSLFFGGVVAIEWAAKRWGLARPTQRRLSIGLVALSGVLLVAFLVLNVASFEGPFVEQSADSVHLS
jgi:hypothetical protein